ncbi:hypothetical protein E2562_028102 [Oryza meyeriana var. granulata]|uniref:Uncharacterized protein n=1 Tax=Oryza meyeriana var. granulata TaxID=110450 RepID=A0A6G1CAH8_9ORYZ|nr:hypothetical protein E2562_028102 [Oryza meyeriana var. granulata]
MAAASSFSGVLPNLSLRHGRLPIHLGAGKASSPMARMHGDFLGYALFPQEPTSEASGIFVTLKIPPF